MADTVAAVTTEVQALLNDTGAILYSAERILPFVNKAYRECQDALNLHGLSNLKEESAAMTVLAGAIIVTSPPSDMLRPTEIAERTVGSTSPYTLMDERSWPPEEIQSERLNYWVWREEAIKFLGATTDRSIRIRYLKQLSALTGDSSILLITNSVTFLAARAAGLVARYVGENNSRADDLDQDAQDRLEALIRLNVRMNQATPTRRQRYWRSQQ
jgi:hypothetical protein